MKKKFVHANQLTKEILISDQVEVEGMEKIGSVDKMPENPKLVVHLMLVRKEYELPVSGWTISYDEEEKE
jgi:hypothetical protein